MTRINTTSFHLSDIQKEVLAKIAAAPNPHMAFEVISDTGNNIERNFAAARDALVDMGAIRVFDNAVEITNEGNQLMNEQGLTDEMGELSPLGQQLAAIDRNEVKSQPDQSTQQDQPEASMDDIPLESFSLFKRVHNNAKLIEDVNKFTK